MKKLFTILFFLLIIHFTLNIDNCKAQWTHANGPNGGTVIGFVNSGTNIFVSTRYSGVFLSTDNGKSWSEKNKGLTDLANSKLTCIGSKIFLGNCKGVFLSTDSGENWFNITKGFTDFDVEALSAIGNSLIAAIRGEIFLSSDEGKSWDCVYSKNIQVSSWSPYHYFILNGSYIFAAKGEGIMASSNAGKSWYYLNNDITKGDIPSIAASGRNLFAGTRGIGIICSTDNGNTWVKVNNGLPYYHTDLRDSTKIFYEPIMALLVAGTKIYASPEGHGVYISNDTGKSWSLSSLQSSVNTIFSSGKKIFVGTEGWRGIYVSTNEGETWSVANNGLTDIKISSFAFKDENIFAGTDNSGVFRSSNNGKSWSEINSGISGKIICRLSANSNFIFAGTWWGIDRSSDNGNSWNNIHNNLNTEVLLTKDTYVFGVGGYKDLFISTDNGDSWKDNNELKVKKINSMVFSDTDIFAGTRDKGIYRSSNNGLSWTQVNNGLPNDYFKNEILYYDILSLAVRGTNIFAGIYNKGIYLSTDNGESWEKIDNIFDNRSYIYIIANKSYILASSSEDSYSYDIHISTDDGKSWLKINKGLPDISIFSLAINNNYVYSGTSRGVYYASIQALIEKNK
jgi:photosystem II stability/assembly factor-like uncharacterized protein